MNYLLTFEKYNIKDKKINKKSREYYFDSNDWSYKVSVYYNDNNPLFPYVGFKAKKLSDPDFNYDMSVITNDNLYRVMSTIKSILEADYSKHVNQGYKFSFSGDKKKSEQRLNLYKRIFPDWNVKYDSINNQYYVSK